MLGEHGAELGAEGHEAALVELRLPDEEQLPLEIDVLDTQPAGFSDA
jgi:hypothetical protein